MRAASLPADLFGVNLVGFSAENGRKLLLSVGLVVIMTGVPRLEVEVGERQRRRAVR